MYKSKVLAKSDVFKRMFINIRKHPFDIQREAYKEKRTVRGKTIALSCGYPEYKNVCLRCGVKEISIYDDECGCRITDGLKSLINPTRKAAQAVKDFGIAMSKINIRDK